MEALRTLCCNCLGKSPLDSSTKRAEARSLNTLQNHAVTPSSSEKSPMMEMQPMVSRFHTEGSAPPKETSTGSEYKISASQGRKNILNAVELGRLDLAKDAISEMKKSKNFELDAPTQLRHDSLKQIPLHFAIEEKKTDIAELLVNEGANPFAIDRIGRTALHYAARKGDEKLAKQLIGRLGNNNINLKDATAQSATALMLAEMGGHVAIAKALREAGAI
ncbi:hypothetical protein SOPP22_07530 [Shewanella sp. OPT22]|nr:hypothetical protein SOPP22_07530 [Shewanella sp. OPT22]